MTSPRGFYGSLVLLLLLPIAIVAAVALNDEEVVIHLALATGTFLLALAIFDFRTPVWVARAAFVGTTALAVIFLLQGLSALSGDDGDSFYDFAYDVLGGATEGVLTAVFLVWCTVMLFTHSQGKTRLFGLAVVPLMLAYDVASTGLLVVADEELPGALKLLFLPVMLWLLLESRKPRSEVKRAEIAA